MVLNDTHKECRKKKTTSKATNKNILYQKRPLKGVDTDKYKKKILTGFIQHWVLFYVREFYRY